ncbi:MAG: tripartite tricarboxylate transporter substrate binding protein, partial [Pseudomonadota bacterium]
IACSYEKAALEAFETQEWADFKASRGSEVVKMGSDDLVEFIATSDGALGETISAIGLAK